jgi:hypothetical protein
MRTRLLTFQAFADALLPHELDYLLGVQQFADPDRREILQRLFIHVRQPQTFDESIDKRKYSYVKKWIQDHLDTADVDRQFTDLLRLEGEVFTDTLSTDSEKRLLKLLKETDPNWFHFRKLYDLALQYRHYLSVRMQRSSAAIAEQYVETHRQAYDYAREVSDRLYLLTKTMAFGSGHSEEGWATSVQWLEQIFFDDGIDGHNRILAFVRLTFMAYHMRRFDTLPAVFEHLERCFSMGQLYSRRILLNYYSQRLLYHAQEHDFERATVYGRLTLRATTSDHLYYANNLAGVLLRLKKAAEALQVLRNAAPEARKSQSFHNRVGHAAYMIAAYNMLGHHLQATTHAEILLKAYRREIFDHRWQSFFAHYWEALLCLGQAGRLLQSAQGGQLIERDQRQQDRPNYLPILPWLWTMAFYMEGRADRSSSTQKLEELFNQVGNNPVPAAVQHMLQLTSRLTPELLPDRLGARPYLPDN